MKLKDIRGEFIHDLQDSSSWRRSCRQGRRCHEFNWSYVGHRITSKEQVSDGPRRLSCFMSDQSGEMCFAARSGGEWD